MADAEIKRLVEPDFTVSLRASRAPLVVVDEELIPEGFWKPQPPKLDRQGLAAFDTLSITTASGKSLQVATGSTQTIDTDLTLQVATGNLLQIRSSSAGVSATFHAKGSVLADFVDVDDIFAQPVPITAQANSILGSKTTGWSLLSVPALSLIAIALLQLTVICAARKRLASQL